MSQTKIYTQLPKAAGAIAVVAKNRKMDKQNWMFRGIDDFINAVHPVLTAHGISVSTSIVQSEHKEYGKNEKGTTQTLSIVRMAAKFYADDGSFVESQAEGMGLDYGDKSANKAMSAAFKYILIQTFTVPTEDMAESDAEEQAPKEKSPLEKFDDWGLANAVEIEQSGNGAAWGTAMQGARLEALATIRKQVIEWKRAK